MEVLNNARIQCKILPGGEVPTVPSVANHETEGWLATDIYKGEFCKSRQVDGSYKIYTRDDNGIVELTRKDYLEAVVSSLLNAIVAEENARKDEDDYLEAFLFAVATNLDAKAPAKLGGLAPPAEPTELTEDDTVVEAFGKLVTTIEILKNSVALNVAPNEAPDGSRTSFTFTLPEGWGGNLEDHKVAVYADTDFGGFVVTRLSNAVVEWYTISENTLTLNAPSVTPTVVFIDIFRNINV